MQLLHTGCSLNNSSFFSNFQYYNSCYYFTTVGLFVLVNQTQNIFLRNQYVLSGVYYNLTLYLKWEIWGSLQVFYVRHHFKELTNPKRRMQVPTYLHSAPNGVSLMFSKLKRFYHDRGVITSLFRFFLV